jgi:TrmH family RNA methyltransferase
MISKNQIKYLSSLSVKKNSQKHQKVLLEGYRLIEESIKAGADIEHIYITENSKNKISTKVLESIDYDIISEIDLKKISDTKNSQGIIATANIEKYYLNTIDQLNNSNVIILDGIQDPGNLGTIFRTCVWFGIKSIILTSNSIDPFNLKCVRSGMGAHFYLDSIISENENTIVDYLHNENYTMIAADLHGDKVEAIDTTNKWALVLGSEAHGLSSLFEKFQKVTIARKGNLESLNVSIACGIIVNQLTKNN